MTYLKKDKGKSVPIKITSDLQRSIISFKKRLIEMSENGEVRDIDHKVIRRIINELDDYDANILIAYFDIAECSCSKLAKILGVTPSIVHTRIKNILNRLKQTQ